MNHELTPEVETRLRDWLVARAPTDLPAEFAIDIASIPRQPVPLHRVRPQRVGSSRRRPPTALLVAAAVAVGLIVAAGGLMVGSVKPDAALRASDRPLAAATAVPSARPARSPVASPIASLPVPGAGQWPSDFRAGGTLFPATLAPGIEHGIVDTPLGRARWVHLQGDPTSLPDPLVPMQGPDGLLVWATRGGPSDRCYNGDPEASECVDPPRPTLAVSTDLLGPRTVRPLPETGSQANVFPVSDTWWYVGSEPAALAWSTDLEAWQDVDLTTPEWPGPAALPHHVELGTVTQVADTPIVSAALVADDPGALLGHPGKHVRLSGEPGAYRALESRPMRDGGDVDLGPIVVEERAGGLTFMDGEGTTVGRLEGVDHRFAEAWAKSGQIRYAQVYSFVDGHLVPKEIPGLAPFAEPWAARLGDTAVLILQDLDGRVRVWRTTDGERWTGGVIARSDDGQALIAPGGVGTNSSESMLIAYGNEEGHGWESTDGVQWTAVTSLPTSPAPLRLGEGYIRTPDQTDGTWQVSTDGTSWTPAPALQRVVSKSSPSGAGSTSESVLADTLFFSVEEGQRPYTRDLWIIQFEEPLP